MKPLLLLLVLMSTLMMPLRESEAASAYPDRPIRLIVPFPPGGGTDLVSRTIQPALEARLGQQVVIDNRGGAQGLLGTAIGGASSPRWLHACRSRRSARSRSPRRSATRSVRPGQGFRADHQADRAAVHHDGASVGASEHARRFHQAGKGEAGRAQLRLRKYDRARRAGALLPDRRPEASAPPVPRLGTVDGGASRQRGPGAVFRSRRGDSADQGRADTRPWR